MELIEELLEKITVFENLSSWRQPGVLVGPMADDFDEYPEEVQKLVKRIDYLARMSLIKPNGTVNFTNMAKIKKAKYKVELYLLNRDGERGGCIETKNGLLTYGVLDKGLKHPPSHYVDGDFRKEENKNALLFAKKRKAMEG